MRAEIVVAKTEHIAPIANNAREADIAELWAAAHVTPKQCMEHGLRYSITAYTGMIDDEPVCMFGATPYSILSGIGIAWMVTAKGLLPPLAQRKFLRASAGAVALLREQFPLLCNVVDDRNDCAKRWLAWLGFTLLDPQVYGRERVPFRPFYLETV